MSFNLTPLGFLLGMGLVHFSVSGLPWVRSWVNNFQFGLMKFSSGQALFFQSILTEFGNIQEKNFLRVHKNVSRVTRVHKNVSRVGLGWPKWPRVGSRHSSVAKVSQDYCETMRPRLVSSLETATLMRDCQKYDILENELLHNNFILPECSRSL